jgi:hypothetical protein
MESGMTTIRQLIQSSPAKANELFAKLAALKKQEQSSALGSMGRTVHWLVPRNGS